MNVIDILILNVVSCLIGMDGRMDVYIDFIYQIHFVASFFFQKCGLDLRLWLMSELLLYCSPFSPLAVKSCFWDISTLQYETFASKLAQTEAA